MAVAPVLFRTCAACSGLRACDFVGRLAAGVVLAVRPVGGHADLLQGQIAARAITPVQLQEATSIKTLITATSHATCGPREHREGARQNPFTICSTSESIYRSFHPETDPAVQLFSRGHIHKFQTRSYESDIYTFSMMIDPNTLFNMTNISCSHSQTVRHWTCDTELKVWLFLFQ